MPKDEKPLKEYEDTNGRGFTRLEPRDLSRLPPALAFEQGLECLRSNPPQPIADVVGSLLDAFTVEVRATAVDRDSVEFTISDLGYAAVGRWSLVGGLDCDTPLPSTSKARIAEAAFEVVTSYRQRNRRR
jgi:hypothetical protein